MHDFPDHIQAGWKVMLEDGFASTPHIGQDGLSKVPTQNCIHGSVRIVKKSSIQMSSSNIISIRNKEYNVIVIL